MNWFGNHQISKVFRKFRQMQLNTATILNPLDCSVVGAGSCVSVDTTIVSAHASRPLNAALMSSIMKSHV